MTEESTLAADHPLVLSFERIDNKVVIYRRRHGVSTWAYDGESKVIHNDPRLSPPVKFNVGDGMNRSTIEVKVEILNVPFVGGGPGPNPYRAKFDVIEYGTKTDTKKKRGASGRVTKETKVDEIILDPIHLPL